MSFSRWWSTRPWPVWFLTLLASLVALALGFDWIYHEDDLPIGPVMLGLAPVLAVGETVHLVVRRRRERAAGVFELRLAAREAMAGGRIPADPRVRAETGRMLPAARHAVRPQARWLSVVPGLLAVSQLVIALDEPRHWILVAFFTGLLVVTLVVVPRQRRRLAELEHALRSGR